jgi:hypothetical protein
MKKSLLAITLAAATVPFTFAQAPAAPASTSNAPVQAPGKTKVKKHHKGKKNKSAAPAAAAPAAPAK